MEFSLAGKIYDSLQSEMENVLKNSLLEASVADHDNPAKLKTDMEAAWFRYRTGLARAREIRDFLQQQGHDPG